MEETPFTNQSGYTLPGNLMAQLKNRYAEPQRHYHTWSHIEQLLREYSAVAEYITHQKALLCALYYHDAIYEIPSSDNERKSAYLLRQELQDLIGADDLALAAKLIMATKDHEVDASLEGTEKQDCELFLDMDMSILGVPRDDYLQYAEEIRSEYSFVPEELYKAGRGKVLAGFLERRRIYFSDYYFEKLEGPARANIEREMKTLSRP
jgi:predicted metal-dependent HD superfamily phosphohydrolase